MPVCHNFSIEYAIEIFATRVRVRSNAAALCRTIEGRKAWVKNGFAGSRLCTGRHPQADEWSDFKNASLRRHQGREAPGEKSRAEDDHHAGRSQEVYRELLGSRAERRRRLAKKKGQRKPTALGGSTPPRSTASGRPALLAQWGDKAEALGWTAGDLFSLHEPRVNPHPSYQRLSRYDATGLLWGLHGRRVIALSSETAAVQTSSGTLIYRKHNKPRLGPGGDSLDDSRKEERGKLSHERTMEHRIRGGRHR
jgi:hypothetical protein